MTLYFNKKHIKVLCIAVCFFYTFFNNISLYAQTSENDSISVDTLKTGLILDNVRRKAKGYIKINNKEKNCSIS